MKRFVCILCAMLLMMGCASAQEMPVEPILLEDAPAPAVLSAVGRCKVETSGSRTVLCFELSTLGETVAEAQSLMETSLTTLRDALSQQGIEEKDIVNTRYDVDSKYEYHYTKLTDTELVTGYTVVVELQARMTDAHNVGQVIDAVDAAGVDCAYDLLYEELHDPAAFDTALAKAAREAVRKAGLMAEASGLKLDALVSMEELPEDAAAVVKVTYTVK